MTSQTVTWQHIDTAPKHKPILVFTRDIGVVPVFWKTTGEPYTAGLRWMELNGAWLVERPGWWMPYPEAPFAKT